MIIRTTLPYITRESGELLLDIAAPEPNGTLRPAVIYVHGGGWMAGDRIVSCNDYLAGAGFFTASIDYRLTDIAPFPAQILDVKAAIRWVRAHADAWQIDPTRIGIWGASAGGHLAALAAVTGDDPAFREEDAIESDAVQCALPICPPTDFLIDWYAVAGIPIHQDAEACMNGLLGGPLLDHLDLAKQASPLWHVSAAAPPQHVIHGVQDDLVAIGQARAYVSALRGYGVDARITEIADATHSVDAGTYVQNDDPNGLKPLATAFFREWLMG